MKPVKVFRGELERDQNVSPFINPDNKRMVQIRCTGERGIFEVRFQIVFFYLVRLGGKMKQRRKCLLQLARSRRDLARKRSATNVGCTQVERLNFWPRKG